MLTSSVVDEVFYVLQTTLRRAMAFANESALAAVLNHVMAVVEDEYRRYLARRLEAGRESSLRAMVTQPPPPHQARSPRPAPVPSVGRGGSVSWAVTLKGKSLYRGPGGGEQGRSRLGLTDRGGCVCGLCCWGGCRACLQGDTLERVGNAMMKDVKGAGGLITGMVGSLSMGKASPSRDKGARNADTAGAAAVASILAAVLTDSYLCGVCSCQEILRRNGRGQQRRRRPAQRPASTRFTSTMCS
eukprot:COSAG01_NODE_1195_length_11304_cov_118.555823_4_plen_244_part_00